MDTRNRARYDRSMLRYPSDLTGQEWSLIEPLISPAKRGAKAGLKRVCEQVNVEIVKRSDAAKFVVLPKRWIVERTIAWLNISDYPGGLKERLRSRHVLRMVAPSIDGRLPAYRG